MAQRVKDLPGWPEIESMINEGFIICGVRSASLEYEWCQEEVVVPLSQLPNAPATGLETIVLRDALVTIYKERLQGSTASPSVK